jgi:hypothetical protein
MSEAEVLALSYILTQHATEQKAIEAQAVTVTVVGSLNPTTRTKAVKAKSKTVPIQGNPEKKATVHGAIMVEKGSLEAKGFLHAMRHARTRDEQITAISAYIGYDRRQDFGPQDVAARAQAQREVSGKVVRGPTRSEQQSAARTLTGYVAGMPDNLQRQIANLLGQETVAADALIGHEKDAADKSRSTVDRTLSAGLVAIERDRLSHIRSQLTALGHK